MDIYKKAAEQKLRIATLRGNLSPEQLFDLKLEELDQLAVSLQDSYEESKGKSFLTKRSVKDANIKLQFDIVLDVLQTKVAKAEAETERRETKEHNEKILNLIKNKQDESLSKKSVKELEAMLK